MTNDRTTQLPGDDDTVNRTLPRSAILRGRNAFTAVFTSGKGVRVGRLTVKYLAAPSDQRALVAGFVMRRGSGNAVRRNRLKRLMREAYRHERSAFEAHVPHDVNLQLVILWNGTRDDVMSETRDRLRGDLATALRKILHRLRSTVIEGSGQ